MPVTELAVLRLPPGETLESPTLRSALQEAKSISEAYANDLSRTISYHPSDNPTHINDSEIPKSTDETLPHISYYYSEHEDPSLLYIIGSWPSTALHMESFTPSPEGTKFFSTLSKAKVTFESIIHIDLEQSSIPLDAPVLVIRHHVVTPMNNASFEEAFEENKHHMAHFSNRKLAGGWQNDKKSDMDKDVFVLFSGWDDVDHHSKFEKSPQAEEYAKVVEWIDEGGLEVRHAVKVDLRS